jgi:hypothetical protein
MLIQFFPYRQQFRKPGCPCVADRVVWSFKPANHEVAAHDGFGQRLCIRVLHAESASARQVDDSCLQFSRHRLCLHLRHKVVEQHECALFLCRSTKLLLEADHISLSSISCRNVALRALYCNGYKPDVTERYQLHLKEPFQEKIRGFSVISGMKTVDFRIRN